ncbi:MAG: hypothetical protein ACI4NP_03650 [Thermoguttaceae bacterium]
MELKKLLSFLICLKVALYGFARDTGEMDQTNDDKGKFDIETILIDASSGFSNDVSVMGKTEGAATCLAFSRHMEEDYDVLKSSSRLTTDYQGRLAISFIGVETIPNYVSPEGVELSYKMAKGEYREVIQAAQKSIAKHAPWWESKPWREGGEKDHWKLTEMEQLLANAYELSGQYGKAMRAYEVLLGRFSEEYQWFLARVAYAEMQSQDVETPQTSLFLCYGCFLNGEIYDLWENEKEALQALLEASAKKKEVNEFGESSNEWRLTFIKYRRAWKRIWRFRERLSRISCPEILYVTSLTPNNNVALYSDLQKESFEKTIEFAKGLPCVNNGERRDFNGIEVLKALNDLPYDVAPNGSLYSEVIRNGVSIPGERDRGTIHRSIFE